MVRSWTRILLAIGVLLAVAMLLAGCQQKVSMQPEEWQGNRSGASAEARRR